MVLIIVCLEAEKLLTWQLLSRMGCYFLQAYALKGMALLPPKIHESITKGSVMRGASAGQGELPGRGSR